MQAEKRKLYSEAEACVMLSVCEKVLRRARKDGQLRYVLIGRSIRYTMDDLDDFISKSRQEGEPCQSTSRKTRRTTISTSRCEIVAFSDLQDARRSGMPRNTRQSRSAKRR